MNNENIMDNIRGDWKTEMRYINLGLLIWRFLTKNVEWNCE